MVEMVVFWVQYHSVLVPVVGVALGAGMVVKGDSVCCSCSCSTITLVWDIVDKMMGWCRGTHPYCQLQIMTGRW